VPGVTAIGHEFGWRTVFWGLAAAGGVAGFALHAWMSKDGPATRSPLSKEIVALRRPQVLLAMAMSLLVCGSTFAVFTYVSPLLLDETKVPAGVLPAMLFIFGVGGAVGMTLGGRLGDWKPFQSIVVLSFAYAIFYLTLPALMDSVTLMAGALALWGFLFLAPCVPLQTRVVREAVEGPRLASTLNQSAFNVGNALGPSLGSAALSLGLGYRSLPLIGALFAFLCAIIALISLALAAKKPLASERAAPATD
jgi:DHA1 family inner membrane transport protein